MSFIHPDTQHNAHHHMINEFWHNALKMGLVERVMKSEVLPFCLHLETSVQVILSSDTQHNAHHHMINEFWHNASKMWLRGLWKVKCSFLSSFWNISSGHYPSQHPVQWPHWFDKWILTQLIWVFTLHNQCLNRGLKGYEK